GPAGVRDENAALSVDQPVPPACDHSGGGRLQARRYQGGQILADICGPIGVVKADARLAIAGGVPRRRQAQKALRRNVDYVDMPIHRFKVSEVRVSDISGDQLRILRKMKSEAWCHSDHMMTVSNRLFAGVIGRMNDQQPTVSA